MDARALRNVLGLFATGVAVVACTSDTGERIASTVSSFNSVSLDPPLVLFSLLNTAASMPAWRMAQHYSVSVLHASQQELSNRFARALSNKWKDVTPAIGPVTGTPLVPGALAWFECRSFAQHPGGDHTIFVGEILSLQARRQSDCQPLVFYKGRYHTLAQEGESGIAADGLWPHAW
jgi:flavin reductase (DIM6/NTAB) family NADH-FMN oxidoreductase RutF